MPVKTVNGTGRQRCPSPACAAPGRAAERAELVCRHTSGSALSALFSGTHSFSLGLFPSPAACGGSTCTTPGVRAPPVRAVRACRRLLGSPRRVRLRRVLMRADLHAHASNACASLLSCTRVFAAPRTCLPAAAAWVNCTYIGEPPCEAWQRTRQGRVACLVWCVTPHNHNRRARLSARVLRTGQGGLRHLCLAPPQRGEPRPVARCPCSSVLRSSGCQVSIAHRQGPQGARSDMPTLSSLSAPCRGRGCITSRRWAPSLSSCSLLPSVCLLLCAPGSRTACPVAAWAVACISAAAPALQRVSRNAGSSNPQQCQR